jgi:photosystem II stability/assembly factor-like uncharacterized protein
MNSWFFWSILLLLSLTACSKEKVELLWEIQAENLPYQLEALHFVDAERGYVVGGDSWYRGEQWLTTDGGDTWVQDSLADKLLYDLVFNDRGKGFAVGIDGYIFRKEELDEQWFFFRYPQWKPLKGAALSPDESCLLVGGASYNQGVVMRLSPEMNMDTVYTLDHELLDVCFSDVHTAHAVGYGIILRSEDAGMSWDTLPFNGDFFQSVCFPTQEIGYTVGLAGSILKTTDAGKTWVTLRDGGSVWVSDRPFRSVFFKSPEEGYIAGENGTLWITRDGGGEWESVTNLPKLDFVDVQVIGNEGWLLAREGAILRFQE